MKSDMKTIPTLSSNWFKRPILITGAQGMLGWEFMQALRAQVPADKLIGCSRSELDVSDPEAVDSYLDEVQPGLIINCAAYTAVDGAESNHEVAYAVNVKGPSNLGRAAKRLGAQVVHFSSDQVFDGKTDQSKTEDDPPNPSNYYAQTKYLGECELVKELSESLILRVQWLYGARKDRFTPLRDKKVFTPFSDQVGAPTWTRDIVWAVVGLLNKEAHGVYHVAYDDHASWAEVYQFAKDKLSLATELRPKKTSEFSLPATRPLFAVLDANKLSQQLGESLGSWQDSLGEFLSTREQT